MKPDLETLFNLLTNAKSLSNADQHFCLPVYEELASDLYTPVSLFLHLKQQYKMTRSDKYAFLFESMEQNGRYSFLSFNPKKVLQLEKGDPLSQIEKEMNILQYINVEGLPPLTGGFIGYISYDVVSEYEPTVPSGQEGLKIPTSIWMWFDHLYIFDHLYNKIYLMQHLYLKKKPESIQTLEELLKPVHHQIQEMKQFLLQPVNNLPSANITNYTKSSSKKIILKQLNEKKEIFIKTVEQLKDHIAKGDLIQIVPSLRLHYPTKKDPFSVYRSLRQINPSAYMYYLDFDYETTGLAVVGSSPEMLIQISQGKVITCPIAGTRKRGKSLEEDLALSQSLLNDPKERAEHLMLVDLSRNDLNRVCKPESVLVSEFMQVKYYSHVMHLVSRVEGQLEPQHSVYDAFRSVFPAGTVSGAPKIRAMQLLRKYEVVLNGSSNRNLYAGSVGYFSYAGSVDTAIAIRTMFFHNGGVYLQAGAGIVHDSNPESEFQEVLQKLLGCVEALQSTE